MKAMARLLFGTMLFPILLWALPLAVRADDWPQWLGPKRDGEWREKGILDKFPEGGPKVRWRTPIGAGYSGPVVVGDRVYVTDRILAEGAKNPANPFDTKTEVPGKERVLCLSDKTGEILWKHEYDCSYRVSYAIGPRTTPVVDEGRVYTLGTMGKLLCLDAAKGTVIWSKDLVADCKAPVPMWGFAASPLIDGDKLFCLVGGEDSVVVAFDKKTGDEKWHALSVGKGNQIGYCPPVIYTFGGKRQLIIWHPESVNGLNPDNGEVYWLQPFAVRANLTIPTPRQDGDRLFLTSFYNGAMMLKFEGDKPSVVWRSKVTSELPERTDTLNSIMPTPFLRGDYIYGICSYGELRCLHADDGNRVWMSLKATEVEDEKVRWANAFLVGHGERFFLFNEKGDLLIAKLTPKGYEEIDRAHILAPTDPSPGRPVAWSHPAFAHQSMYARNDKELVCVSLAK